MLTGSATMYTINIDTNMSNVYGYSVLLGAGTGLIFQAGYTVGGVKTMMRTGSGLDVQRVISMLNLSQLGFQMGSLLIGGQIFQSLAMKNLTHVLEGQGFSQDEIRGAVAGTASNIFSSLSPDLKQAAISGIVDAISDVYSISIAAGTITLICAVFMKKERLFHNAAAPNMVVAGSLRLYTGINHALAMLYCFFLTYRPRYVAITFTLAPDFTFVFVFEIETVIKIYRLCLLLLN